MIDLNNVVVTDAEVGLNNFSVNGGSLAAGQEVTVTEVEAGVLNQESVCEASGEFMNTVNGLNTFVSFRSPRATNL